MSAKYLSAFAAEMAKVFWEGMKETPGQMVAPFVAAWREVMKWGIPQEDGHGQHDVDGRHLR